MRFKYIEQKNLGPAAARNAGVRASTGELLVFMDDDCTPRPGWLGSILKVYEAHPDACGVSGTLVASSKGSAIDYWEAQEFIVLFNKLNALYGTDFFHEGRVWFHFGCNGSYRREAFLKLRGFDESRRLMEDTDFQWRLFDAGLPIYYTPDAVVEHNGQKRFFRELTRCYRGGIAYRSFRKLHPGYANLISESSTGKSSLVKNIVSGARRASSYVSSPHVKAYFICLALTHKLMYALGYFNQSSVQSEPVYLDCPESSTEREKAGVSSVV